MVGWFLAFHTFARATIPTVSHEYNEVKQYTLKYGYYQTHKIQLLPALLVREVRWYSARLSILYTELKFHSSLITIDVADMQCNITKVNITDNNEQYMPGYGKVEFRLPPILSHGLQSLL